jgi:hypothetical protein
MVAFVPCSRTLVVQESGKAQADGIGYGPRTILEAIVAVGRL